MEKTENYHIHDSKNVAIKSQNVTQIDPTAAVRSNVMQGLTDVLIVTVTPVESRTLLDIFKRGLSRDAKIETINGHAYYDLGRINKASTFMGFSEMGAAGPGGSQQSVRRAIEALQPYSVIMVGIAFGVDERKQAIGEVLVSQQLRLYDLQRVGKDHIRLRGDRPHASTRLINLCQACIPLWPGARVRIGTILTGDKLVDNIDYRDELRRLEPEAVVGEMEGAGLYVACEEKKIDWILVKSICDWGDGNKDNTNKEQDQEVAAQNAAGFVLHVLQRVSLARPDRPALDAADLEKEDHKAEWPVYQIAFLWHEIDPPAAQVHWNLMNRDVADTKEMLHRAVEEGKLAVAREYRSANGVTRYVTRAELERFAISIGERPRFLFKESRCIA